MTFNEARKILGLGPDEDPRPHLGEFQIVREKIARMVREAPNENLALRYQDGLLEFDRALAACREYLEALGLSMGPVEEPVKDMETTPPVEEPPVETAAPAKSFTWVAWLLVFLTGAAGGGWLYLKNEWENERRLNERITYLGREGNIYVENRRWQEATRSFKEIEKLSPGSALVHEGRAKIAAGIKEEESQFIAYWTGQAIAELDAGRLDDAEAAAQRVLEKHPDEREAAALLRRVAAAREDLTRQKARAAARRLLDERQWQQAIKSAHSILDADPSDTDAAEILKSATAALEKEKNDQARAVELFNMAEARDHGQFDQQALDWLREAAVLAPGDGRIAALLEKMASYTRTLRVPGDFATPAEALAAARDRDRIVLTGQTWKGPLLVNAAVDLEGAGPGQTIVTCPPEDGSPIVIGPDARGARISGITFRHETFLADGRERFAAAMVRGGGATFVDCHFLEASGHGLVVIESGEAIANRCRFSSNGWNGASAIGAGSRLEARDCESLDNFGHGIESWDGASVTLVNNRCEGNTRNGIHADNRQAAAEIDGNQLVSNREYGLVLTSAGAGNAVRNTARGNLLGGYVIRHAAAAVVVNGNHARDNQGPGLILEKGLNASDYAGNELGNNTPRDSLSNVDFSGADGADGQ